MTRSIAAVLMVAVAFIISPVAVAAEATQEKCTCDLKDPRLNNGASVRNATACWAHQNDNTQWCDISVQAIQDDGRLQSLIDQLDFLHTNPLQLGAFLRQQVDISFGGLGGTWVADDFDHIQAEFAVLLMEFGERVSECVERFLHRQETNESVPAIEEGQFECRVGEVTGWLRMTFVLDDTRIVYMLAPDA